MRLIDADELIVIGFDDEDGKTFDFVPKEFIDQAPTIEAEPIKHGHWVNGFNSPLKCSSCGIVNRANEITLRTDFKFCPYCGARMREVTE